MGALSARRAAFLFVVAGTLASTAVLEAAPRRRPERSQRAARVSAERPLPTPIEGATALAPFFESLLALETSRTTPSTNDGPSLVAPTPTIVRVLHFGDSHTAADVWTGRIRARLQERFGDAGPGLLLPARRWRGFPHHGVRMFFSREWPATSLRDKEGDGLVGLTGAALMVPERDALSVVGSFRGFEVTTLGAAGLPPGLGLVRPPPERLPVTASLGPATDSSSVPTFAAGGPRAAPTSSDGAADGPATPADIPTAPADVPATPPAAPTTPTDVSTLPFPDFTPEYTEIPLPSGPVVHISAQAVLEANEPLELNVHVREGDRLLGVELRSGEPGVLYDELGLSGAEITDFERWDPSLRRVLLERAAPALVVVAFGTNDMGRGDLTLEGYREQAAEVLHRLGEEAHAPLLVVGPTDRAARRRRTSRLLSATEPLVVRALREAAAATGNAFWDTRAAMGGDGAISRWRRQGLAQRDLVHLTGLGYQRLGDLLSDALLSACEAYRSARSSAGAPQTTATPLP